MTIEMIKDFSSALVGLFLMPVSFLMVFHLIRKWITS